MRAAVAADDAAVVVETTVAAVADVVVVVVAVTMVVVADASKGTVGRSEPHRVRVVRCQMRPHEWTIHAAFVDGEPA